MREIKFRAWHRVADEMLFDGDKHGTNHPLDCCSFLIERQPVELMQYTGLKGKNNADIYEGDIISFKSEWDHHVCTVVFFECKFTFGKQIKGDLGINDDCDLASFMQEADCDGYTVIGNIYENPELLK